MKTTTTRSTGGRFLSTDNNKRFKQAHILNNTKELNIKVLSLKGYVLTLPIIVGKN